MIPFLSECLRMIRNSRPGHTTLCIRVVLVLVVATLLPAIAPRANAAAERRMTEAVVGLRLEAVAHGAHTGIGLGIHGVAAHSRGACSQRGFHFGQWYCLTPASAPCDRACDRNVGI